jgi:hypothetical protein
VEAKMKVCLSLALVAGLLAAAGDRLGAHHSYAATYLEDDSIEISGTVVEFRYENPHSWLFVNGSEVNGPGGAKIYAAEWVGTAALERQDIEKDTLKPGDRVRVWGSPAKNPSEAKLHLKRIERSDGWSWRGRQAERR